jgi:hypothetical protein
MLAGFEGEDGRGGVGLGEKEYPGDLARLCKFEKNSCQIKTLKLFWLLKELETRLTR